MADGAFNTACGGLVLLCDGGVEDLCYRIYYFSVVYREKNGGAEILIIVRVLFALLLRQFIA